jgi:hypothetical protein
LSDAECKELAKVTLTIMEIDKFAEDIPVGETKYAEGTTRRAQILDRLQKLAGNEHR